MKKMPVVEARDLAMACVVMRNTREKPRVALLPDLVQALATMAEQEKALIAQLNYNKSRLQKMTAKGKS